MAHISQIDLFFAEQTPAELVRGLPSGIPAVDAAARLIRRGDGSGAETVLADYLGAQDGAAPGVAALFAAGVAIELQGRVDEANGLYRQIASHSAAGGRERAWAWNGLRKNGVFPDAEQGPEVLGVVLEVWLPDGIDLIAGYAGGGSRFAGQRGVFIDESVRSSDSKQIVSDLIEAGQRLRNKTLPLKGIRSRVLDPETVRYSLCTPAGLRTATEQLEWAREGKSGLHHLFLGASKLLDELRSLTGTDTTAGLVH